MNAIKCFFGAHSLKIIDQHVRIFTQKIDGTVRKEYPITAYVLQCQHCGTLKHQDVIGSFTGGKP